MSMAKSSSMWTILMMLVLFLAISKCEAKEYLVGGSESSWLLPPPQADWLNQWASTHRFMIGDSLLWKYDDEGSDQGVLQVKEEHYHNCNKSNPIHEVLHSSNNGGRKSSRVVLKRAGAYYFVSGAQDQCEQGLKLHVEVLSGSHFFGICPLCHGSTPKDPPPHPIPIWPFLNLHPPKSSTPPNGRHCHPRMTPG